MNYYLIDFENVKTDGIKDLNGVNSGDSLIFFYSDNCQNITIDLMEQIAQRNLQLKAFKAITGTKNALDFQLSSYIGYLLGQMAEEDKYFIVSNDKGFDCVCEFWKSQGAPVERISLQKKTPLINKADIIPNATEKTNAKPQTKSKVKSSELATPQEVQGYLSKSDRPNDVVPIINKYKTRTAINNGLVKLYGNTKKAGAVYKKLRPLLKEKNKT